jgi:hypothetical protein
MAIIQLLSNQFYNYPNIINEKILKRGDLNWWDNKKCYCSEFEDIMSHLRNSSFNNSDYGYNELEVVTEIIDLCK